jgi:hypothetical protein
MPPAVRSLRLCHTIAAPNPIARHRCAEKEGHLLRVGNLETRSLQQFFFTQISHPPSLDGMPDTVFDMRAGVGHAETDLGLQIRVHSKF